ncbi:MAG: hypothetical protein LBF85_11555, partial [Tannerella sp.]|nr:hypothetical protein [Tannerella sp.]
PDQPYRIEIKETKDAAFNGQVTVKPYSVTLLKFNGSLRTERIRDFQFYRIAEFAGFTEICHSAIL